MQLGSRLVCFTLIVFAIGCGNSTPRTLQSVTANPASADAKDFPSGRVQFIASGTFNKPPTTVTPLPVTAWLVQGNTVATIDKNGTAECLPLQVGTVKIQVAVAGDGPLMDVAQLTCP
jgi:hypothetical protein